MKKDYLDGFKMKWLVGIIKFNNDNDFYYSHVLTTKLRLQPYRGTVIPLNFMVRGVDHEEMALVFPTHSSAVKFIDLLEDPPEDMVVIPLTNGDLKRGVLEED